MLSVLLLVSFTLSYGQNITLNLRNTTVSRAVTEIQKMYGYSVVVKSDGLDMERVVSVSLSGDDVKGALTKIFAGQPVDVEVNASDKPEIRKDYVENFTLKNVKVNGEKVE